MRHGLALLLALAAAPILRADALDDFLKTQMVNRHVPGMAVAVVKDGSPLAFRSDGLSNLEWETPITEDTVFAIGSLSKQFLAAGVMLLVQDGNLRLDARVSTVVPGLPEAWGAVTIRQLLTHTSGIRSYTDLPGFEDGNALPVTHEELIARVAKEPLLFSPGTRFAYSNTGSYLLGMVVEKLSGLPYAEFFRKRIAVPAGLTATRMDVTEDVIPRRAAGYEWTPKGFRKPHAEHPSWPYAGGAVLSTARDLAQWDNVVRQGKLLSRASLEAMWSPLALAGGGGRFPYGFFWHVEPYRSRRAVWHTGHTYGFSSAMLLFPEAGLTVIVLTNASTSSPLRIARSAASFFDKAFPAAERVATRPDERVTSAARVRRAMEEAAHPGAPPVELTPGLAAALTPAARAKAAGLLGSLKSVGIVTCDKATEGTEVYGAKVAQVCTVRLFLESGMLDVDHWLTADGRVAWLDADTD